MKSHHPVVGAAIVGLLSALSASACKTDGADRPMRANVPNAAEPGSTANDAPPSGGKMSCTAEMMGSAAPAERGKMSCAPGRCGAQMSSEPSATSSASAAPPASNEHHHPTPTATPSNAPKAAPSASGKTSDAEIPVASPPAAPASATPSGEAMACGGKMGCSPAMMGSK